jgi:hypothetical protein
MRNSIRIGLAAIAVIGLTALTASAQPQSQYGGLSPNFQSTPYGSSYGQVSPYGLNDYYNPSSQPLSPYLNLLRGGNPAVNYYYGVRPAQNQNAYGQPFVGATGMGGRQTFFPQVDTLSDLEGEPKTVGMRPTGHPFGFNNTLSYFGPTGSGMNRNNAGGQGPLANKLGGTGTGGATSTPR